MRTPRRKMPPECCKSFANSQFKSSGRIRNGYLLLQHARCSIADRKGAVRSHVTECARHLRCVPWYPGSSVDSNCTMHTPTDCVAGLSMPAMEIRGVQTSSSTSCEPWTTNLRTPDPFFYTLAG